MLQPLHRIIVTYNHMQGASRQTGCVGKLSATNYFAVGNNLCVGAIFCFASARHHISVMWFGLVLWFHKTVHY